MHTDNFNIEKFVKIIILILVRIFLGKLCLNNALFYEVEISLLNININEYQYKINVTIFNSMQNINVRFPAN